MATGEDRGTPGGGGGRGQRSVEQSLEGGLNRVLQYAVEHMAPGGAPEPEAREPLTEEKKEFLNQVFNEMLRDEVKEMKGHVEVLRKLQDSEKVDDQEQKEECLEALMDLCETLDNAQDFLKVGGVNIAVALCGDPSSEVRWRALDLLAVSVQNNPMNQKALLDRDALRLFLNLLDNDSDYQVRVKALYAVSCLVRENELAVEALLEADVFSSLMRAMQTDIEKLQVKAAFLLSALLWEQPKFNDVLHDMGMVHQLIHLLRAEHKMHHEHIMAAILHLVSQHPGCHADSLHPGLGFRSFLEERGKELNGKEEFLEELELCQKLIDFYSKDAEFDINAGADR